MKAVLKVVLSELKAISMFVLFLVLLILSQKISGVKNTDATIINYILYSVVTYVFLCVLIFFAHKVYRHSVEGYSVNRNIKKNVSKWVFGLVIGLVVCLITQIFSWLSGYTTTANPNLIISYFISTLFFLFAQSCTEEIIFRAFVITEFEKFKNRGILILGIVLSSLLFAYSHNGHQGFNVFTFITYTFVALVLSYLFYVTKNLWLVSGIHAGWNIVSLIIFRFTYPTDSPNTSTINIVTNPKGIDAELFGNKLSVYTIDNIATLTAIILFALIGTAYLFKYRKAPLNKQKSE
ncbi:CPBP family intramembrane glutamic endopeptidase [Paenibacillus sp. Soil787]|uniref:CPBP family intramembrane glutamic endopeptidase n=1 Tax=Paenibacillus sp. Soil787 TaxID=1736411 RepID=UPI0006F9C0D3|nr:CPBP family intramembrane glutamic endopeptidase [Paenibacillus sp. Soil787]KRF30463.1 hypothetical protein ASG93_27410 [Paenibacillus sp. Soil787]